NEEDLSTNEFRELFREGEPIYRDEVNNCFSKDDIKDILLKQRSTQNPYNRKALWSDRKGFERVIDILDSKSKDEIRELYFPSELSIEVQEAIARYPQIFEAIASAGAILKADETPTFTPSTIEIASL